MKELSSSRLIVIALICGVVAAALTIFYLKSIEDKYRQANQPKKEVMVSVVVARSNLPKGTVMNAQNMAARQIPEAYLPSNAVMASDFKKIANRTLMEPVSKGRPMSWSAVTGNATKTFSDNVELGRRGKTIKVSKIDSFDGLLRAGDKIDLMVELELSDLGLSGSSDADMSETIIMPVLEMVEVLAAGREDLNGRRYERTKQQNSVDGFNMEFTMISLNLSPKQIARLELAESTGDVFAVLRNPKDTSVANFEYLGVDLLLQKDEPEPIDMVLDENGKPIGRIVGDNIVDANGNIVGKVVDGKAVALDGKPLGQIVKNIDPNDPINRVAEVVDVVRDKDGNIIGKVVDGKIIDASGNVVGRVDANGRAIGIDGKVMGTVDKDVALDASGNEVDVSESAAAVSKARRQQVVRDKDGNIIGRVVNGQVVDSQGRVVGTVDENGRAVGLDGKRLGTTEEVLVDRNGNVVASEAKVVRDKNGNIIGRVIDGKVIDSSGKVIGTVDADGKVRSIPQEVVRDKDGNIIGRVVDGKVIDADGNVIGEVGDDGVPVGLNGEVLGRVDTVQEEIGVVETAMVDKDGKVMGSVQEVVRDENGNIIGRVVNGEVIDADGNVVGRVDADGTAIGLDGKVLGNVEKVVTDADGRPLAESVDVVRDKDGNIIGRIVDGKVIDAEGNVVGVVKDGQVIDANGNVVASGITVTSEDPVSVDAEQTAAQAAQITREVQYIDFISGGSAKDGITPVQRVRLE